MPLASSIPRGLKVSITRLRTRIKRLVRRTICFSKTERMHDIVIGLFINRYEARSGNLMLYQQL